jgi:hypothetical protein
MGRPVILLHDPKSNAEKIIGTRRKESFASRIADAELGNRFHLVFI